MYNIYFNNSSVYLQNFILITLKKYNVQIGLYKYSWKTQCRQVNPNERLDRGKAFRAFATELNTQLKDLGVLVDD